MKKEKNPWCIQSVLRQIKKILSRKDFFDWKTGRFFKYKPEYLSIEKLYMTVNQKTAMNVAEARGVVIYESQKSNIPIYEFTPMEIKMAVTGFGKATKNDVAKMVPKLIVLENKKMKDDEIDAIAIALTLSATIRYRNM
ncbi:crossover junction endodeoxyribonuclease RuvC [Candidatus Nomurabacteria bacterium]|nr:MAG: crossover junction endodeoxyribonuclease RuvC [Candidatus Nomurabacteria bacterium]